MILDEIRKWKEAQPFRKFKLVLASGEELVVPWRGSLGIGPENRFILYAVEPAGYRLVAPADVTAVSPAEGSAA